MRRPRQEPPIESRWARRLPLGADRRYRRLLICAADCVPQTGRAGITWIRSPAGLYASEVRQATKMCGL